MEGFKSACSKASGSECGEAFSDFAPKRSKPYPKPMPPLVERRGSTFRFCEFPKPMHKAIYTSNAAGSLDSTAKRKARARIQYNSEDSALIVLAKIYEDYNRNARPARLMLELSEEEKESMGFNR